MAVILTNSTYLRTVAENEIYEAAYEAAIAPDSSEARAYLATCKRRNRGLVTPQAATKITTKARERVAYVDRMAALGIYL